MVFAVAVSVHAVSYVAVVSVGAIVAVSVDAVVMEEDHL